MLSIERVPSKNIVQISKFRIVEVDERDNRAIATVEGLTPAACLLRFLKGSHLAPREYQLAVNTMAEIDTRKEVAKNEG